MERCSYTFDIGDGQGNVIRKQCVLSPEHAMPHRVEEVEKRKDERFELRKAVADFHGIRWPQEREE